MLPRAVQLSERARETGRRDRDEDQVGAVELVIDFAQHADLEAIGQLDAPLRIVEVSELTVAVRPSSGSVVPLEVNTLRFFQYVGSATGSKPADAAVTVTDVMAADLEAEPVGTSHRLTTVQKWVLAITVAVVIITGHFDSSRWKSPPNNTA